MLGEPPSASISKTLEAFCPETCRFASLNHQRPKAILHVAVHVLHPSIFLWFVSRAIADLNTARLRIIKVIEDFVSAIQHNFLYHAIGLAFDPSIFTLQRFSCFSLWIHVNCLKQTTGFIDKDHEVPYSSCQPHIHDFGIIVYHYSMSNFSMTPPEIGRVRHCSLHTRQTSTQRRALMQIHVSDNIYVLHLLYGTLFSVGKACMPHE